MMFNFSIKNDCYPVYIPAIPDRFTNNFALFGIRTDPSYGNPLFGERFKVSSVTVKSDQLKKGHKENWEKPVTTFQNN